MQAYTLVLLISETAQVSKRAHQGARAGPLPRCLLVDGLMPHNQLRASSPFNFFP